MKAQASLETLLLIAALISTSALLMPKLAEFYNATVFAIDSSNASSFAQKLASEAEKLSIFEEASTTSIQATPNLKWSIYASDGEITLEVESEQLQKTKTISKQANARFEEFEHSFSKSFEIRLKKQGGKILIVNG